MIIKLNKYRNQLSIMSYKVINNEIIASLSDGKKYIVPYTEENRKKINNIMEKELLSAHEINFAFHKMTLLWLGIPSIMYPIEAGFSTLSSITTFILYHILFIFSWVIFIYNKRISLRIRKAKFLHENKENFKYFKINFDNSLNDIIINKNLFIGVSKKGIEIITEKLTNNQNPFDIEYIDLYSIKDINQIFENIDRINEFDLQEFPNNKLLDDNKPEEDSDKLIDKDINNLLENINDLDDDDLDETIIIKTNNNTKKLILK